MAKISKEELKRRKVELGRHAREELAKTEVMRFRLDPNNILKLCELAEKKRQHVGAMVREWVLERMEAEANPPYQTAALSYRAKTPLNAMCSESKVQTSVDCGNPVFDNILQRLECLEKEMRRLPKRKSN